MPGGQPPAEGRTGHRSVCLAEDGALRLPTTACSPLPVPSPCTLRARAQCQCPAALPELSPWPPPGTTRWAAAPDRCRPTAQAGPWPGASGSAVGSGTAQPAHRAVRAAGAVPGAGQSRPWATQLGPGLWDEGAWPCHSGSLRVQVRGRLSPRHARKELLETLAQGGGQSGLAARRGPLRSSPPQDLPGGTWGKLHLNAPSVGQSWEPRCLRLLSKSQQVQY